MRSDRKNDTPPEAQIQVDLRLPGGKLTPKLVFTRSCRDGMCCSMDSVTVLQNSLSALKELEAKDRAMMWSVCEHKHGA